MIALAVLTPLVPAVAMPDDPGTTPSPPPTESATPTATPTATPSPTSSPTPSPTPLPALTCPSDPAALTSAQGDVLMSIGATRLGAAMTGATRNRFPFGAPGSTTHLARTSVRAWTSGFFPSSLWLMYERTGDAAWLRQARRWTEPTKQIAGWTGTHDLGFMVGLPTSLGMALDPSPTHRARYRKTFITAAQSLSKRWNTRVQAVKSGSYNGRWGLIIDSAMNMPLLIEGGTLLGGAKGRTLRARGEAHLVTLARQLVRPDGSTYHRMAFDPRTGRRLGPVAGQGLDRADSTWARGQAWAINGFASGYALTHNPEILNAARLTASHWMRLVPAGCVPPWDLDLVDATSNARSSIPLDSSAAAIAADGLLRLASVEPDAVLAASMREYALTTLGTLTRGDWLGAGKVSPGVLQRQSFNVPSDPREGTYVWGDTYLLLGALDSGITTRTVATRPLPAAPTSTPTTEPTPSPSPTVQPTG